jgi:Virulence-associated protein E/RepB DNA-primase from phage plasmid
MSDHSENNVGELPKNVDHAVEFLANLRGGTPIHLTAILPDGGVINKTFDVGDRDGLARFIVEQNGTRNLYYHVNPLKAGISNVKAKKEMIAAAEFAQVDIDDVDAFARLQAFPIPPTAVVASGGGGANALWKFKKPILDLEQAERINRWLVEQLDGDRAATDVSRILRMPGTKNLPTKKKREKGRKVAWARIHDELTDWTRTYDMSDFGAVEDVQPAPKATAVVVQSSESEVEGAAEVTVQELPEGLTERMKAVAELGDDPERPRGKPKAHYPSRSEVVFAVACALARQGKSPEEIAGVLLNPKLGVSESILEKRNPKAEAMRQAHKALLAVGETWPDGANEETGIPFRGFQNTQAAILRLGISCRYDIFRNRMTVSGQVLQTYVGDLSDRLCLYVRDLIGKKYQFDPMSEMTRESVVHLSSMNTFDPVRDYIEGLKWDGIPRIDEFLMKFAGAEDSEYVRAVSAIMLIAAVRRVRHPGCKYDTIVVLEGDQGSGKSTLLRILASDDFFSDQDLLALETKAQMEVMEGVWIFEICELAGMRHTDVNKVKAFASRSVDKARPAYGRVSEIRPRRGILVGTTNDDQYLKDETGNRRFWPVLTTATDLDGLQGVRDQLWAEAAVREASGETIVLPKELWSAAAVEQAKRVAPDPWQDILANVKGWAFNGRELIASRHLLEEVLQIPKLRTESYLPKRLARVMRGLGWRGPETLTFQHGGKAKGYWRPTDQADEPFEGGI